MITLLDAVAKLPSLPRTHTIFIESAKHWAPDSRVKVEPEPEDGNLSAFDGFEYFLEVDVARHFLEDWVSTVGSAASDLDQCKRLIQYARYDA